MMTATPTQNSLLSSPVRALKARVADYLQLSKSGIVTLVLISVLGGYLIGQPLDRPFSPSRLLLTLFGVLFLASGSSALNQLQEWRIDSQMPRTAKRPIPSGRMTPGQVLGFVLATLAIGLGLLAWISLDLLLLGAAAVVSYNFLYTLWWKKHWAYAAVPGAVPGALPILMGYAAATGEVFSPGGIYLFFILFYWQMPHFWVLALKYRADYALGSIPTLPVARGQEVTVMQISIWCLAYIGITLMAPFFLPVGSFYLLATLPMSAKLLLELRSFSLEPDGKRWLHFFLWVNFSLIAYIAAAAIDCWGPQILMPYLTRAQ
jgi:protoheme IX farnesyltransferase